MLRIRPPLWARWALSLGIGVLLLAGLVVFVHSNDDNGEATQNPAAVERANREAEIVVQQDQAPHTARLAGGAAPRAGIASAVRADMRAMIGQGVIEGPLGQTGCRRAGARGARVAFRCTAVAAGVKYPFLGVVDTSSRRVTYCKHDQPPVPRMNIPVSRRCTA